MADKFVIEGYAVEFMVSLALDGIDHLDSKNIKKYGPMGAKEIGFKKADFLTACENVKTRVERRADGIYKNGRLEISC